MSQLNHTVINLISLPFQYFDLIVFSLVGVFTYILYTYIFYPYHLGPLRNLPRPKNSLLHVLKLYYYRSIGDCEHYLKLNQDYGPVVHLFGQYVLLNDLSTRKYWMTYKFKKSAYYEFFNFKGPTLFSAIDRELHSRIKKLVLPAFSNKTLANIEGTVYRVGSQGLVDFIQFNSRNSNQEVFDILHLFHCSTFDVISELVFGTNLNTIFDQEKTRYYINVVAKTQKMMFLRTIIPFYNKIPFPMEKLFAPIILENIRLRENKPNNDILQSMIDSKDPETGEKLTNVQIVDECLNLLFAGMDTTANTLTWTLYELLKNPEIYKLVENEILTNFPNLNEPITVDKAKSELKYLEAVILESMRRHPVASGGLPRVVPKGGITVAGHYLPEETKIYFPIFTQHNDPQYWENPEKYDIHRWLGDQRDKYKSQLVTFGLGPRSCIGRDLAWNEVYLVLANLIRNFEMELIDKELTPSFKFLYTPKEKRMRVKITLKN